MSPTTITSRRFNQDASGAKRAALDGPVFITDRGRPAHVLLSIEAYRALTGEAAETTPSILDLIADPAADMPFEAPRLDAKAWPADLT
jgi:PHD/YefM family antitoxin component YafN of YafNO toxin-antitoxin module